LTEAAARGVLYKRDACEQWTKDGKGAIE